MFERLASFRQPLDERPGRVEVAERDERLAQVRQDRVETGLAVMNACPGLAVWATLSTSGLEQVQLPAQATRIIILADHDASGAGLRAAETTINRVNCLQEYRPKEGGPKQDLQWRPLRKGIAGLHRRAEISQKVNERVIQSLGGVHRRHPATGHRQEAAGAGVAPLG